MKCPKCQFENREGARFCNECGNKFDVTCRNAMLPTELAANIAMNVDTN